MISKKAQEYANENGYKLYVNGCGHRTLAQITTLDDKPVTWTANNSKAAIATIRNLVQQRKLAAQSNTQITSAATQAMELITV